MISVRERLQGFSLTVGLLTITLAVLIGFILLPVGLLILLLLRLIYRRASSSLPPRKIA